MSNIPSHRRKLSRAETHIKDVETLISTWERDGYRTFEKPNAEGRTVLFAEQLKPLPDDLPLIVGDALQCLRNSLDHIIFALSKDCTPNMTPEDEGKTSFPILDVAVTENDHRIQFMNPDARRDVCAIAPDPARQPLNQDSLWLLNKVQNRDKHREIVLEPHPVPGAGLELFASDGTDYFRIFGDKVLEMGADPVAVVEFARSPGVHAQITVAVPIRFQQGIEIGGREVAPTLWWMHDHIRDTVFQRLEQHL